jgi:hypothetical protein
MLATRSSLRVTRRFDLGGQAIALLPLPAVTVACLAVGMSSSQPAAD